MSLNPYVFFDGTCEEAIRFYQDAVGAELRYKMTFGEMPANEAHASEGCTSAPDFPPENIMHANVRIAGNDVMMSDGNQGQNENRHQGYALTLTTRDVNEGRRWFDNLSQQGNVTMPWSETFWAYGFGMVTDKFGIPWMVNVEKPMA